MGQQARISLRDEKEKKEENNRKAGRVGFGWIKDKTGPTGLKERASRSNLMTGTVWTRYLLLVSGRGVHDQRWTLQDLLYSQTELMGLT
ncbi:hypothetical protein RRG08_025623 [Elysia crispata]|uniref:Uncharacterized protein n=1 Tax=Elysia crispata TaxID=231223 RepID=A0AAE0YE49_9GAST|nr:hypothetical protein RRG08_025623 [Elysia crispata]